LPELERVRESIRQKARPGLLAGKRAAVEAELPTAPLARQAGQLEALYRGEQAFGPVAEEMTGVEIRERARGVAAQRMGFRQTPLGTRTYDEEGRMSGLQHIRAWVEGLVVEAITTVSPKTGRALNLAGYEGSGVSELSQLPALTEEVLQELKTMNQQTQQPTMGKPGVNEMLGTDPEDK
jgi:hypothetical protein